MQSFCFFYWMLLTFKLVQVWSKAEKIQQIASTKPKAKLPSQQANDTRHSNKRSLKRHKP
jgi:hypothetical protein